jgi:hypothetical protein
MFTVFLFLYFASSVAVDLGGTCSASTFHSDCCILVVRMCFFLYLNPGALLPAF